MREGGRKEGMEGVSEGGWDGGREGGREREEEEEGRERGREGGRGGRNGCTEQSPYHLGPLKTVFWQTTKDCTWPLFAIHHKIDFK